MMPTRFMPSLNSGHGGVFPSTASKPVVPFVASSRRTVLIILGTPAPRRIPVHSVPGTLRAGAPPFGRCRAQAKEPSLPDGVVRSHPHLRPHPPHSYDIPISPLSGLCNAFAVHTAPERPPSGSALSLVLPS